MQKMVQFGDDNYDEERAVEKLFRCLTEMYKQMARSIESLLDLSTILIEEAIGRLKVIDTDEPQPLSGLITTGGKLLLTREQCQDDRKKGSLLPRQAVATRKRGKPRKDAQAGARGRAEGDARGGAPVAPSAGTGRHETTPAAPAASLAIGPGNVDSHDAASPTSHRRRRRRLCSWYMLASATSSGTGCCGSPPP
jgi:hypothetical protein